MSPSVFPERLEKCKDFGDIFGVVKKAVKLTTGRVRAGLMLYLGNLPLYVGAFHGVGSNGIVLNRRLLRKISFGKTTELSSYVFMLLLHEYLHSLGYISEENVRSLVHEISKEHFGGDHPTAQYALNPPIPKIPPSELRSYPHDEIELEIIKDFDRSNLSYIN